MASSINFILTKDGVQIFSNGKQQGNETDQDKE